jgi:thiazole/oxazole-forming peptide maturase SagD family component
MQNLDLLNPTRTESQMNIWLKPGLSVAYLSPNRCAVFDANTEHLFNGDLFFKVCNAVKAPTTIKSLINKFGIRHRPHILYILSILSNLGIIVSEQILFDSVNPDLSLFQNKPVILAGDWPIYTRDAIFKAFDNLTHEVPVDDRNLYEKSILLVHFNSYLDPRMSKFDDMAQSLGIPWIPFRSAGAITWYGPVLNWSGPSWTLLRNRLTETHPIEALVFEKADSIIQSAVSYSGEAAHLFRSAVDAINLVTREGLSALSSIFVCDAHSKIVEEHHLGCLRGLDNFDVQRESLQNLATSRTLKFADAIGGTRSKNALETLGRLRQIVSPLTGIVKKSYDVSNGPYKFVFHSRAVVPLAASSSNLPKPLEISAAGKGLDVNQAEVSCLAEAIERYSSVYRGDEKIITEGDENLHLRKIRMVDLVHYSSHQHEIRSAWNEKYHGLFHVCRKPSGNDVENWVKGWSLTDKVEVLIPAMFCYFHYTGADAAALDFRADSNGCASGVSMAEATLQGLYELIERDSVAIWWYRMMKRGYAVFEGHVQNIVDQSRLEYSKVGRILNILDITSDIGVPTYCAISYRDDGSKIGFGLGCHIEPGLAVSRAISELHQFLVSMEAPRLKEEASHPSGRFAREWFDKQLISDHPFLFGNPEKVEVLRKAHGTSSWIEDELEHCISQLKKSNIEIVAVDLTRKECPLYTVRVISTKLRHFWPRFAPGRLYDANIAVEDEMRRLTEQALNPTPFFL